MNEADQGRANRREFFRGSVRYSLLAALGAVSAMLFQRSGGKLSGQTCANQGVCSKCTAFTGCGLPQALSRKQFDSGSRRRESAQTSRTERDVHAVSLSGREDRATLGYRPSAIGDSQPVSSGPTKGAVT